MSRPKHNSYRAHVYSPYIKSMSIGTWAYKRNVIALSLSSLPVTRAEPQLHDQGECIGDHYRRSGGLGSSGL
jgi:hypothetical protein